MKNSALYATAMTELADAQMLPATFDAGILVEETPSTSKICRKEFNGKLRVIAIIDSDRNGAKAVTFASEWDTFIYDTEEEAINAVNMESRSIDERGFI